MLFTVSFILVILYKYNKMENNYNTKNNKLKMLLLTKHLVVLGFL